MRKAPIGILQRLFLGSDQVKFISQHVIKATYPYLQSARVVASGDEEQEVQCGIKELADNPGQIN